MAVLHKVLVPFDGSPHSRAALEHAVALAEDGDATIDVLDVDASGEREPLAVTSATERDEIDRAAADAVEQAKARLGERVARRTVAGDPLRKIIETASEGAFDLIVIGTHGRVGRLHEMIGSVAEGVVRNAPCPVLTVREPAGGYQSFAERRHGRPSLAEQIQHRHR